jgi:hypothetical protein
VLQQVSDLEAVLRRQVVVQFHWCPLHSCSVLSGGASLRTIA